MDGDRVVPDVEWATMVYFFFFFLERMELGVSELLGCASRMVAVKRNDDDVDVDIDIDIEVDTRDKDPGAKIRPCT